MSEKEKYLDLIQTIDGKESWKAGLKTCVEDEVFRKHPEKAWALISDDPKNISLFSVPFLLDNRAMVEYVYNRAFSKEENILGSIPYQILKGFYCDIQKKVAAKGKLLKLVPEALQNEYVQIPYDAVKNDPFAIVHASVDALLRYPDISMLALKSGWTFYPLIPLEVRIRYDFKNMIR